MIKVHALVDPYTGIGGRRGVDGQCMSDCPVRVIID